MNKIRIGTRGSRLALRQASLVQEALLRANSGIETEIVVLHTKGDKIQDKPLSEIGDKGVFASEFEQALLENRIDIAVHSAKDLPMVLAEGLTIAAVLPRADVRDVLVVPEGRRIPLITGYGREISERSNRKENCTGGTARETMEIIDGSGRLSDPAGCGEKREQSVREDQEDVRDTFIIGSGSRRRQLQAEKLWKNVVCENIRGNVDTRMRKLQEDSYDGIILAKAGLDRLGIGNDSGQSDGFTCYPLPPDQFLPAACQGIIAVEAVLNSGVAALCREITDAETELCFLIEREVLAQLSADCSEAAAAWCRREKEGLTLDIMYAEKRQRFAVKKVKHDGVWEYEVCPAEDNVERGKTCLTDNMEKRLICPTYDTEEKNAGMREDMSRKFTYTTEMAAGLEMARQASALVKRKGKERI